MHRQKSMVLSGLIGVVPSDCMRFYNSRLRPEQNQHTVHAGLIEGFDQRLLNYFLWSLGLVKGWSEALNDYL